MPTVGGEITLSTGKPGSQLDQLVHDGAAMCSLLLQHGVPFDSIRAALLMDEHGLPDTAIGMALSHVAKLNNREG
jgi:hypothetical protein